MSENLLGTETPTESTRNESADAMLGDDEASLYETDAEAQAKALADAKAEEDTNDEDDNVPAPEDEDDVDDDNDDDGDEDDAQRAFEEAGLDKRYSSVADLVRQHKANDGYVTKIQQINADQRRQLDQRREQASRETHRESTVDIDADKFLENPNAALDSGGYVKMDQVEAFIADRDAKSDARRAVERQDEDAQRFVDSKSDFEAMQPRMSQIIAERPILNSIAPAEALSIAYELAKGEQPQKRTTKRSNKDKAARAKTLSGRSKSKAPKGDLNYEAMSIDQLEKELGFADD